MIITSPNCGSKPDYVTVTVNPLPVVSVCCDQTINEGQSAILTGSGALNYAWFGNPTISNPTGNPVTVEPLINSDYVMFGIDANGCESSDTVHIIVIPSNELYFYNTFSPNNDGINDYFMPQFSPYGLDTKTYEMEIYDRWGHVIFTSKDYLKGWDGSVPNQASTTQKQDSYLYRIKFRDLDGKVYFKTGYFNLIGG